MKRDAPLAALNSNYRERLRARCLFNVSRGIMEPEPHIKVGVAEAGRSTTSKYEGEPPTPQIDECILATGTSFSC